ncbi:AraC family transcriptional regulator [Pinibacter aurantiacus]|uniref:AraC family transcriptional regulator n=1 Tax=Pinibacter aurantiacus TaxID=2851599 RepID=A0A9E2SER3_9BACT|nr:AraC family transcriptional regulator [Pinibacter aurantiacus]MBV4359315.1 AraC family transcriptional regulator [Pinibacter aurantiacus]
MKTFIEKLPLAVDSSFVARTHRTPLFEVPWHQHIEFELILFTEGGGLSFVGNAVDEFEVDDIFFLGSNLPHTFQKSTEDLITSAVVIHFRDDFWGQDFLNLPESKSVKKLLATSAHGMKIMGETKAVLKPYIKALESESGFSKIVRLCECLQILAETKDYTLVSTQQIKALNPHEQKRIDNIFQYTMANFKSPIELTVIANIANMSVPAFCSYFKKRTRKTYLDFVHEIRIGYACKLLLSTQMSILDICYESGFETIANFNRQFLRRKGMTPGKFRKSY